MPDFSTTIFTTERIYMVDFARARTGAAHRRFPESTTPATATTPSPQSTAQS